ncbi:MAG: flavin reductase family protein [Treponema sp.]|nr:flavin reductase family protein [Treponema sp.]
MKKNLGKTVFFPMPVLIVGTYDQNGVANAMNAAWGGRYDADKVVIALSKHKTTENFENTGAFTVAFATKQTVVESDYFGIASGRDEDKIAKAGFHAVKSQFVNAPVFEEYPLTLECKVVSWKDEVLVGEVVNVSVDDAYLDENGKLDAQRCQFISYDETNTSYRVLGDVVGKAFKDGNKLKG